MESQEGQGTVFHILLPAEIGVEPTIPPSPLPRDAIGHWKRPAGKGGGRWVLLAEDEDLLREALTVQLTEDGYRVLAARNGDEALEILDTHGDQLSLVLSDVTMPGKGAVEIICQLNAAHPSIPLVFMSGFTREVVEAKTGPITCDGFLTKPFTYAQIAAELQRLLDIGHG